MKIIFHERFYEVYTTDPAAASGRMEAIMEVLGKDFQFVDAPPARDEDLTRVHTSGHVERIKKSRDIYEVGILSAGGAILAAQLAYNGESAFGLIRPPGHHASPDSCWGFCYFNNMAIALRNLIKEGKIKTALVLDFDLHFGDGTENAFMGDSNVDYFHPEGTSNKDFIQKVERHLERSSGIDILAVSAGFDRHVQDWGGLLETEDYRTIGSLVKTYSQKACQGRRFGVLEGGYNHEVLGYNVRAFVEGMT